MSLLNDVLVSQRKYYTYHFYNGLALVHGGITIDPKRRETEHQQVWPYGHLLVIGGPMTEAEARAWERANGFA